MASSTLSAFALTRSTCTRSSSISFTTSSGFSITTPAPPQPDTTGFAQPAFPSPTRFVTSPLPQLFPPAPTLLALPRPHRHPLPFNTPAARGAPFFWLLVDDGAERALEHLLERADAAHTLCPLSNAADRTPVPSPPIICVPLPVPLPTFLACPATPCPPPACSPSPAACSTGASAGACTPAFEPAAAPAPAPTPASPVPSL